MLEGGDTVVGGAYLFNAGRLLTFPTYRVATYKGRHLFDGGCLIK